MEIKKIIIITQEDYESSYYKVKIEYDSYENITQVDYETSFFKLTIKDGN